MTIDIDTVTKILRETAETVVLPRFRRLAEGEVSEKAPGDLVTVADQEAEEIISRRLREILDVPLVGEEAASSDPGLTRALLAEPRVWVVDPLDGTRNFVHGDERFAVMVALVYRGRSIVSWILRPTLDRVHVAELGSGAWCDGRRVRREPAPADPALLRGAARGRSLSTAERAHVEGSAPALAGLERGSGCVGVDYPRLAEGGLDFMLFSGTRPWDHAPGSLLLTEAGGVCLRPEGEPYRPDGEGRLLLTAADERTWRTVRPMMIP
ncbi:inositol monophosphatase family protein [Nocardiopsis alba]|uniref:inositol monophosphatase family protein n=1 Tax=Nocardiopsis alba TaxID=53437 RepID=UPI0002E6A3EE|nr:inositol monophosphatase [Nocardiopsis alba]